MREVEERWRKRFGPEGIDELRASLVELIDAFELDLPDSLPILGYGLAHRGECVPRPAEARDEGYAAQPLPALLAKALLMFALEFEKESHVSLAIGANILRLAGDGDLRVRDLPRLAGISKEAIAMALGFLEKRGYAVASCIAEAGRTAAE